MKFDVHLPCNQLEPYVRHLIISENELINAYKIIPDIALVIGFQYRGKLSFLENNTEIPLSSAGITGLMDTPRIFKNTSQVGSVLVVFRESGAAKFLCTPLHELFNESLSLEYFFNQSSLAELEDKLVAAPDDKSRIVYVEQFLIEHLQERSVDLLVNRALEYIHQSNGTIRMNELASLLNTSVSPLEKRFRQVVGASPKKFATIVRARSVLSAMEQGHERYVEYLSAFYDQSHFIKDFKKFTSVTPEQYLKNLK